MEQQRTVQQQDELEEMQHGPVPVDQLQKKKVEEGFPVANSYCSVWMLSIPLYCHHGINKLIPLERSISHGT
ncbi:hypothetical protein RchiOBHm_Chr2g0096361 [Rosa chinensis]|uniref:Uncharacterized protein n=1 Tax=Rosa chinensis TaxID=74649 RepID=A0A2P6RL25_ROSCH|nr:hypothetical protein RchiOBHm_Chr2g0096361 [Rosa chinensis]